MNLLDKENLSVDDISRLFADRVFADYFNVFLSLPVSVLFQISNFRTNLRIEVK